MSKYTTTQWRELCQIVQKEVPPQLGSNAWTLLIASALSTSPSPELMAEFYTYLTKNETNFSTDDGVQGLSLRLRDILLKQVTINGAPQVLMAMTPLAAAEGSPQEKAPASQLTEKWKSFDNEAIQKRGTSTIYSIYGPKLLHEKIFPMWGLHTQDVQFMELFTVYGLYLSDYEQLTPIETELVVFTSITCLGLGTGPSLWHLRGLGRLLGARGVETGDDVSEEQVRKIHEVKDMLRGVKTSIMAVVEFVGSEFERKAKIEAWPNVGDVQRALGGWGEDA